MKKSSAVNRIKTKVRNTKPVNGKSAGNVKQSKSSRTQKINLHSRRADSRDNSIGIIIKDLGYSFYTEIAAGAREYAESKGYSLLISVSEDIVEKEKKLTNLFSLKDIKGVIIAPVNGDKPEADHISRLKLLDYPFVLLEDLKGVSANVVSADYNRAIKKAVNYLADLGHTRIMYFTDLPGCCKSIERSEVFINSLKERHLNPDNKIAAPGTAYEECFRRTSELFSNKNKHDFPSAVICYNDKQALPVMAALTALKINIPNEISVISFDDIYYSKIYPIPLTTYRAAQKDIGKKAAEILIRNIETPGIEAVERVFFDTELIVRESTAKYLK